MVGRMMLGVAALLGLGVGLMFGAGCAWGRPAGESLQARYDEGAVSAPAASPPAPAEKSLRALGYAGGETQAETAAEDSAEPSAGERLRIYTARYEILVPSVEDAVARLLALVEGKQGWLEARQGGEVTCRVPAKDFFALLEELPSFGTILDRSLNAADVTRQHQDLSIRLENARKSRARLLELLEQAKETKDLLEIERELRRLSDEIERLEAQLRGLENQIAFSTLTVSFRSQAPPPKPPGRRGPSRFEWLNRVGVEPMLEDF